MEKVSKTCDGHINECHLATMITDVKLFPPRNHISTWCLGTRDLCIVQGTTNNTYIHSYIHTNIQTYTKYIIYI